MFKIFNKILKIASNKRKLSFLIFIIITFISSFADVISIGLIIPFIGLFLDYHQTTNFISKFNILDLPLEEPEIYYLFTILFIFALIFSTILKIFQSYFGLKVNESFRYEISSNFYFKLVNLKYLNHDFINENNSNSNIQKINQLTGFTGAFLAFVTHTLNLIFIFILLILIDINLFFSLALLGLLLFSFNQIFKSLLIRNSKLISINIDERTKILNNTIGYLPFIIINNLKDFFYNRYAKIDYQISKSNFLIVFFSKIPNLVFMTIVISLIAIIVLYYRIQLPNDIFIAKIATIAGVIAALLRSLPQLINLQGSLSTLRSNKKIVEDVLNYISRIKSSHYSVDKKLNYKEIKKIEFKNLNYSYDAKNKQNKIIKNLNFKINKGDRIFINGDSGSGKTTVVKLILGLIQPSSGNIYINSKKTNYRKFSLTEKKFSYVSQDIFLSNASFFENLTLGLSDRIVDYKKVVDICKIVKMHDLIAKKKNGYNTEVSHHARNISGGQKQRIGIARALIRQPEILVLDESTNSMDPTTEKEVIENIIKLLIDKTIIFVSHNKNLSKFFNKHYVLKNCKLIKC